MNSLRIEEHGDFRLEINEPAWVPASDTELPMKSLAKKEPKSSWAQSRNPPLLKHS